MSYRRKLVIQSLSLILTVNKRAEAIFNNETTLILEGKHSDHTLDMQGNFLHPFKNQDSGIEAIHYPESGTFSLKLSR